MSLAIEAALDTNGRDDPAVALVVIDAAGDKAFCAGGDIATIYRQITGGDLAGPRRFWRDEYRMNAQARRLPETRRRPDAGLRDGRRGRHRLPRRAPDRRRDRRRMAMPECGIGLIPDVGGSLLLAHAPGRSGEYLGLTGTRMIRRRRDLRRLRRPLHPRGRLAGADRRPRRHRPDRRGGRGLPDPARQPAGRSPGPHRHCFSGALPGILAALDPDADCGRRRPRRARRASPLSLAVTLRRSAPRASRTACVRRWRWNTASPGARPRPPISSKASAR